MSRSARAVHARYLVEYAGSSPAQDSHVPWEQLDERYRADNRAQAEHIGTKLAEIDAVIVPARQTCRRSPSPRDPQGDVECLQGWSTTGTMYQRHRREARTRPGQ